MRHRAVIAAAIAVAVVGAVGLVSNAVGASPSHGSLGNYKHLVVIYEENHSFDNLYGLWGKVGHQKVDGLPGGHHAGRPVGRADQLPAAERREPRDDHVDGHLVGRDDPPRPAVRRVLRHIAARHRVRQPLRLQRAVLDQRLRQPAGQDVCAAHQVRGERRRERRPAGTAGRMHPRHRAPFLPGAVPARRR